MGKLHGPVQFTGKVGEITAYRRKGSDEIIVRSREGIEGSRIKNDENFIRTRENNAEFGGRARAASQVTHALDLLKPLADYNIVGPITARLARIQRAAKGERGQRAVMLSHNPRLMEGFSLNRKVHFDSILRGTLTWTLSRETLSATVSIPQLIPGINFVAPKSYAMYRIVAVLGMVSDVAYVKGDFAPLNETLIGKYASAKTDWRPMKKGLDETVLELKIDERLRPANSSYSIMLAVGVSFGAMDDFSTVEQVGHAGAAKVLAMA